MQNSRRVLGALPGNLYWLPTFLSPESTTKQSRTLVLRKSIPGAMGNNHNYFREFLEGVKVMVYIKYLAQHLMDTGP